MEGRTSAGAPVYNFSLPLLKKSNPAQPWFRLMEVDDEVEEGKS